jgi:hypothetical protein
VLTAVLAVSILTIAQTTNKGPIVRMTATTDNVANPGQAVRIELFAWSNDTDRDQFAKAWTNPVQPVQPAAAADGGGGGGGRGGRGGRGGAAPAAAVADANAGAPVGAAQAARGGGRGGRGARGGGRGGDAAPLPVIPVTPTMSLASALQKAQSVGMLWTSETVGYSIRYAYRVPQPDGSEHIILATDRRLGAWNDFWKSAGTAPTSDYPFSIIELRLTSAGLGEGKVSLGSINVDSGVKSIALENYTTLPVVLKAVKKQIAK